MLRINKLTDYAVLAAAQLASMQGESLRGASKREASEHREGRVGAGRAVDGARGPVHEGHEGPVTGDDFPGVPSCRPVSALELSAETGVPLPTMSKVLKGLNRAGLVEARRGARGGYVLARAPEEITVEEIICVFEGPIALTECAQRSGSSRDTSGACASWSRGHRAPADAIGLQLLGAAVRPREDAVVEGCCEHDGRCLTQAHWQKINGVVREALARTRLSDMVETGRLSKTELMPPGRETLRESATELG